MPGFHYSAGITLSADEIGERIAPCATKFAWFMKNGYSPHYWQSLFHSGWKADDPDQGLCRFRHLVAGRRGGKTMSAAWELAYYVLHPEEFHWDAHRVKSSRPLHVWVVTKDFPTGHPALVWFREVLAAAGAEHGHEYRENKGNHWFEFDNGSFVHFRSAEDPESLRGAGNDIIWMDEAAFIPSKRAWEVSRPSLSDRLGQLWTTTTPDGKNWLYKEFWNEQKIQDPKELRVEYRSIDNPAFPQQEWEDLLVSYHPMLFRQEYMAAFDSMAGRELHGDWLKYYHSEDLPRNPETKQLDLDVYFGIDPAISLADDADRFAISVIGVTKDKSQAYLLDLFADRISFPEQIEKIEELAVQWRPMLIGVEAVAYQLALSQQALRIPGFLPIIPMLAPGKKHIRILSMAPLFRTGRIKIQKSHYDFINEWIDYDSTRSNPDDDCLDATEIALRMAGALLPGDFSKQSDEWTPAGSMDELARRLAPRPMSDEDWGVDEHLGADF
jgi:phage terminase large subunit-like protein